MPRNRIMVRSKTTGLTAEIAAEALDHFPDYEPVEAAPEAVFVEPELPPAEAVETPKTSRRSTAAKTTEEE
ncbi:hypothetical protein DMB42_11555 [Nonomuraea sp. WAC 01424]|uniref:hypothetical protein n=1 Tax=Nonomuraea sp. WAC 01424 TaxID=2203200 RepID=UPI000F791BBD|nr:hypothetical protein [Nonomuraea sp. WAC 01424]RSN12807.1 hypothetical protein DMB42_11555 [Nonomuraea sp. WAC 01424]